jgi:2-polyprenyl-6-methoxyphenol hydroxylase-like FAD-dependent oxidoreductase
VPATRPVAVVSRGPGHTPPRGRPEQRLTRPPLLLESRAVPEVVVVGAGVSGLAAAKVFADAGMDVRVLERAAEFERGGAGLTLWPNGARALERIGMLDEVRPHLMEVARALIQAPSGEVVSELPLDHISRQFGSLSGVARDDLLAAMHSQVTAPIQFGCEVRFDGEQLTVAGAPLEADAIVGADGIGSAVRDFVAGHVAPRPAGYSAFRGIADIAPGSPPTTSETVGRGKRFGIVPLTGERTYWFAVLAGATGEEDLAREFAGWHDPIGRLLDATPPEHRSYLPISDLPPLSVWHRAGAVLVGDAAHAMTPNLGQGAAQSLLDVAALADLLRAGGIERAFAVYQEQRKRQAELVTARSRAWGRIAQSRSPIVAAVRDFATAHMPPALVARRLAPLLRGSASAPALPG